MVYTSRRGDLGHKSTVFKTSPPKKTETGPDCKPVLTGHSKENSGPENLASKLLNNKYLPKNRVWFLFEYHADPQLFWDL